MSGKRLAEAASRLIVHIRPISNVHRSVRREQETRVLSRLHQSIIFICCTFMAVLCGLSSGPWKRVKRRVETTTGLGVEEMIGAQELDEPSRSIIRFHEDVRRPSWRSNRILQSE